jgi:multiple sugar transport system ATP-binding protein
MPFSAIRRELLRGRLGVGRAAVVHFAAGAIDLPMRAAAALVQHGDRDVIVGVRPEDLYENAPAGGPPEIARLPARVVAVEPLGAETLLVVALDASNEELIARIGRDTGLRSGNRFDIAMDTAAIHLFDSATTKGIVYWEYGDE